MLRDLTKDDWLTILGIPPDRLPRVLLLRGTRDLRGNYERFRRLCRNVLDLADHNRVVDDVFLGELAGVSVAYASVYGPSMASEITHVFGVLGTPLVVQCGNCGALDDRIETGDLFTATEAFCGEGTAHNYLPGTDTVTASWDVRMADVFVEAGGTPPHRGRIYTTAALFAEGDRELEEWAQRGFAAVDMETATTFAVAQHFGMDRLSLLYAWDNPRRRHHILMHDDDKNRRRALGDQHMTELILRLVSRYGALADR